ncbi:MULTISPECIES: hypothetical protein [Hyphomicrobiales]|uniref:hypothetical protein n=1 Tax=Hyphomicrobiales TaxID=356 RepID=UPI003C568FA9
MTISEQDGALRILKRYKPSFLRLPCAAIVERCEAERLAAHRDLEALKERQFGAAQQSRLRQAQERKGIAELHRMERQQLAQAHDRSRGREIGVSQRAFERAADRKQLTLEEAHGLSRGPSR